MAQQIEATFEAQPEKSTTDPEPNKTCDECGDPFYAYVIPGREDYVCNDCKAERRRC